MCQKIPLKDYLLKPSFLSGKYTDNRGRVKTGEYDLDLNEFLIVCCLTSISTISKTRKQYARWWPLWSDFCIREEYEKQQDTSFRKDKWKSGLTFCCEVQILSLNRPRSSWGGKRDFKSQSRKGNKTLTKEEKRKSRIFFSLPPRYMAWRPPALFFSRGFMTESF